MPRPRKTEKKQKTKAIASTQSLSSFVKSICDIMRRSNCASALQYVPELTWILFLRILDAQEQREAEAFEVVGEDSFSFALTSPYRWQDWAAPHTDKADHPRTPEGKPYGWKRQELFAAGDGKLFEFINKELLPFLHKLGINEDGTANEYASPKQQVIGRIMTAVERVRVDSETNLRDILDLVDQISIDHIDDTHFFTLSQVYEDLLLKMGEKNSDGGQFFTPREVIRAMVRTIEPQLGERVYDPCCGTGGFLAQSYEYLAETYKNTLSSTALDTLKTRTFYGREKENLVYPIALANLVLHGIDRPHIWHGNTLTGKTTYGALFQGAPERFEVILTNPPFGGKEGKDAQKNYSFETSSTQVLFLQHVLEELAPKGRCGVVLDEGLLFRTNESAFVETKRKLLDECNLWCIVSLPGGVFSTAGAGVKTNLLFFTKGRKTERIWYYDLSHVKVGKKSPLTLAHFKHYFEMLPKHGTPEGDSEFSWTVDFAARRTRAREEAAPYKAEEERHKAIVVEQKELLAKLRKADPQDETAITACRDAIASADKAAREAAAKADAIDAACYDLKAVNPHVREETDTRLPSEIIAAIEEHGKAADVALSRLKKLLNR